MTYDKTVVPNPLNVLRRAGYSAFRDPVTREDSFVLRPTAEFYPRFHLYVEYAPNGDVIFSLHLDQKKASYGEGHAHAGEYSGPTIEKEMRRIDGWVKQVLRDEGEVTPSDVKQSARVQANTQKPWWWPF
ncbi:MAG: hypothetical protein UY72_C0034G0002 [Candidatus Uhrbacteria bacterium GW2011_GWD2_52_7]|uniref:Uncharacterized protein n=1 Tax=Candidatus Uhrbacteria bacterium GW2011_GWD2_52_7 TaxID=1618989 RepID=A0A0G2ABI0_9BACT|nr:MAG: hypothetical protein UY72_C0034G0002 [Candidatus Uhrbacteria bacterium GW2011_GWD2_52_7]